MTERAVYFPSSIILGGGVDMSDKSPIPSELKCEGETHWHKISESHCQCGKVTSTDPLAIIYLDEVKPMTEAYYTDLANRLTH